MIAFLIKMTVCMLLLMGIYQLLLARTAMHQFKRFYLLFSLILPIIIPFVELESQDPKASMIAVNENLTAQLLPQVTNETVLAEPKETLQTIASEPVEAISASDDINYQWWLTALYGLIAFALLTRYGIGIYAILKKAKKAASTDFQGSRISILDQAVAPHNFLHLIFISRKDFEDGVARKRLLTHELSHARQLHTIDILLLEFLRIIFWFNPLYFFWSKAIRINHEYLADAAVLSQFNDVNTYKKLLLSFAGHQSSGPRLASPSNYSLTKKRFIMMTKKISKISSVLRLAILTPLLIFSAVAMTLKTSVPEITTDERTSTLLPQQTHPSFEGAKPSIFPIDEKYNPEFLLHFDATMYKGTDREYNHQGVDYRAASGTAVRATGDGTVITSAKNAAHGNHVVIKHGDEYQTLYASLDKLLVEAGQQVKKGMNIGTVGKSIENSNIHLHYEVIKNGKRIDPQEYYLLKRTPAFLRDIHRVNLGVRGFMIAKEYGLKQPLRSAHFPEDWKYKSIVYDKNKVVFLRNDSQEARTLNMTELTEEQKEALRGLKSDIRALDKTPLKDEIIQEWQDPDKYLVIIDGKLIENSTLADFNPENVAFYWKMKLRKNDPAKPVYRIDILSEDGYQQLMKNEQAQVMKLERANKAFLKVIGE